MDKLEKYYNHLQNELLSRRDAITELVSHRATKGMYFEQLIRDFLKPRIMGNSIGHGVAIFDDGSSSTQLDVIIYDDSIAAPIFRSGELIAIPAKAIKAIIEVKAVFAVVSSWKKELTKVNDTFTQWPATMKPLILYFCFESDKYHAEDHEMWMKELVKKQQTVLDSFYALKTRSGINSGELQRFVERLSELLSA